MEEAPLYNEMAEGPAGGRAWWLKAGDGVRIRSAWWPGGKRGTVLLFPGRTEYVEKYGRTAADLAGLGYGTIAVDWRGQGLADRLTADPLVGHVGAFADYQLDVVALTEMARQLDCPGPWFLLGHSMGGCIGLRALHEGLPVRAALFSAPMWGIQMSRPTRPFAWAISWLASRLGRGASFAPSTDRVTYVLNTPFEENALTSDPEMFAYMQRHAREHPELTIAGPSLRWLYEALLETRRLRTMAPPAQPALTFLGTHETIVDQPAIHLVMEKWMNGHLERVPGAQHEILMERPSIRAFFFERSTEFMASHAG